MRPTVEAPIRIRNIEYGGAQPLFCIPLVGASVADLTGQAAIAHALAPDLIEWRADFFHDLSAGALTAAARELRASIGEEAVIFTLRVKAEGGAQWMAQAERRASIEAVLRSGCVDLVDLELASEAEFLAPLLSTAKECGVRAILAFHDFEKTPGSEELLAKVEAMRAAGADVAKLAVMPRAAEDVFRVFEMTAEARRRYPALPLAIMSMGALGSITRVANFLYGSDMAFAVGKEASAPGQIPIADARSMTELLLRYA